VHPALAFILLMLRPVAKHAFIDFNGELPRPELRAQKAKRTTRLLWMRQIALNIRVLCVKFACAFTNVIAAFGNGH